LPNFIESLEFCGKFSFRVSGKRLEANAAIKQTKPIIDIGIQRPYLPYKAEKYSDK
jgi:hypothetical protein